MMRRNGTSACVHLSGAPGWSCSSPQSACFIADWKCGEEPVMPRMVERTGFDEGQYQGGYYDLHFYARADRVYGAMGYQYPSTLGIYLDVEIGIPEAGLRFDPYQETTYSYNSRNHEHMWNSGIVLATKASASYSINGGTIRGLGGTGLLD